MRPFLPLFLTMWATAAVAQPYGPTPATLPISGGTLTGAITAPSYNANGTLIAFGAQGGATVVSGGTGNAVGDVLTLNDGCSTHTKITVSGVSVGAVTIYTITVPGSCASPPIGTLSVASTTGAGSGATFTVPYTPVGSTMSLGTLASNSGNTFLGAEQSLNYAGAESTFIGDRAGGAVASGSFNWAAGHSAFGIGGSCSNIYMNNGTVTGTDNLRNACGGGGAAGFDTYGEGVLKTYNQAGTSSNNYLAGMAAFGAGALYYWNGAVANPYDTVFGNQACQGASSGTVNFTGVLCLGARSGTQLTTASNSIIINASGAGGCVVACTTFATGSGVILVATGIVTVDTPAAGTTNFINFDNTIIATSAHPAWNSGFCNSAGWSGTGQGSTVFLFNVGSACATGTGTIVFPTAAPHGWLCTSRSTTAPATSVQDVASTSATTVTVTNYVRTTGLAGNFTSSDVLEVSCWGY